MKKIIHFPHNSAMDKEAYIKLLKGGGKRYKNSNLYVLENKASTVEERAVWVKYVHRLN
jgi:hypothetical protein